MSSEKLKSFSYVVLALIGDQGAGAHDIARWMEEAGVYWASAASQWYAEPKRLEKLGYLSAMREPGKTKPRTHYTLTTTGRAAIRDWLDTPAPFPRIQNEAAVRLLAGDLIDDSKIVRSLRGMLPEIERLEEGVSRALSRVDRVPHRTRYLRLSALWAKELLAMHRRWIAAVEEALFEDGVDEPDGHRGG